MVIEAEGIRQRHNENGIMVTEVEDSVALIGEVGVVDVMVLTSTDRISQKMRPTSHVTRVIRSATLRPTALIVYLSFKKP